MANGGFTTTLAFALPAAIATLIGVYMGVRYLQGVRNTGWVIMVHLLLGLAGLEIMAVQLRGAPNGSHIAGSSLVNWMAALLAASLLTGLFVAIIAKPKPAAIGPALAVHALVGSIGFVALLLWVAG